jgi:hypothetical protein
MRRTGTPSGAIALAAVALLIGGCGDDKGDSGGNKVSGKETAALAGIQQAASDAVRETSYKDKAGSKRAYGVFGEFFKTARGPIHAKSPDLEDRIQEASVELGDTLRKGDLGKAAREAKALQKAVNDAVTAVTGKKAGTKQGLVAVLEQMKAAARDLDEEAKNRDKKGTRRALQAFQKLYVSTRDQIEAKDVHASEAIATGIEKVRKALKGKDDKGQVLRTTDDLLRAVGAVEQKTE